MIVKRGAVPGVVGGSAVIATEKTDRAREVEFQLALKKMELESENKKKEDGIGG